jgi:excisionase family DNA binding protein
MYEQTNQNDIIDIKGAVEFTALKESNIRKMVFLKLIPFIKVGKLLRFSKSDLRKWLEAQKEGFKL